MQKVHLITLGCKVNQFESASFGNSLEDQGMLLTSELATADVIIINTCAVTGKASANSRREIRKAARANPLARIIVTGCQAELLKDEPNRLPEIEAGRLSLIGNDQKEHLAGLVGSACGLKEEEPSPESGSGSGEISRLPVRRFAGRTRAYLRIQDGCNSYCSYCIVPHTRGRSRSLPLPEVLAQALEYVRHGHREIVITGIHVGQYGKDLADPVDIAYLVEQLCRSNREVRFRLSSIEPLEISEKLLTLMAEMGNFMPHLHVPLQSGDNEILSRMNRRYTREQFISVMQTCRKRVPDAAIGIDVMVGFPGESADQFDNTRALLEQIDCTYLHVFPYSKRPGTPAALFPGQIARQEKNRRVEELRALSENKKTRFYLRHAGRRRAALLERERNGAGLLKGFTDNYIPVVVEADDCLMNRIVTVELERPVGGAVTASLVPDR